MTDKVVVYKNRTNVLPVDLGMDVSGDTFTSEIRDKATSTGTLVATWAVTFDSDGTDGLLRLELQNEDLSNVTVKKGYMDIKRVSGGEPLPVFDFPLEVEFRESITT